MKTMILVSSLLFSYSLFAGTVSYDFLDCRESEITLGRCKIDPVALTSYDRFHMDFTINYRLPCRGHQIPLAFKVQDQVLPVAFTKTTMAVTISGQGTVYFDDLDPGSTYTAAFDKGCRLEIESISYSPSFQTLTWLREKAVLQAKILTQAIDLYWLSMDVEHIQDWPETKLATLLNAVENKIILFQQDCTAGSDIACRTVMHLEQMAHYLEVQLNHQPLPVLLGDDEASAALSDLFRASMMAEASKAQAILNDFNDLRLTAAAELSDAMALLPNE